MVGIKMDGPARDRVMQLIQEKDRIESEIRNQNAVLESNNVGMHDPLVDAEGFPRNDIDVYKVRHARHQIICLQNDHKNLMKQIERGLAEVHADIRGNSGEGSNLYGHSNGHTNGHTTSHQNSTLSSVVSGNNIPFATVSSVLDGSPADVAGLCDDDDIIQFGSINHDNFDDITQIHMIITHSVGQPITVRVKRDNNVMNLTVVPRPWQQPGLLGCHIRRKS